MNANDEIHNQLNELKTQLDATKDEVTERGKRCYDLVEQIGATPQLADDGVWVAVGLRNIAVEAERAAAALEAQHARRQEEYAERAGYDLDMQEELWVTSQALMSGAARMRAEAGEARAAAAERANRDWHSVFALSDWMSAVEGPGWPPVD